jgi:protein TonB
MFDDALLESRRDRQLGGRKKSLPIAIGLHAAAIAAIVGAAVWNTGEPPEPYIPVIFTPPSLPPPPRGTGGHTTPDTRKITHIQPAVARVPVLREVPSTAAPDPEGPAPPESGLQQSDVDGPPGDRSGKEGGTGDEPSIGDEPTPGDAPIRISRDVKPPVLVSMIQPLYPESMRLGHKEGVVILEAVITASGEVDDVRVLKSEGSVLDRAASDAVRQWRYRPATLNGRAVSVYLTVTVTFGLNPRV